MSRDIKSIQTYQATVAPWRLAPATLALLAAQIAAFCQPHSRDLMELSLEDLLNIKVTSVARRDQKLSRSASAIYVITDEDIRRSGATTIPDALRLAPGVQVAQIDGGKWAVSVRGFSSRFSNKLLVMIDGRSIYSPVFGGVYWEASDVLLEDIDRIEVIRGPGSTMWGSNAVNGVINIITKHTRETQGATITAGGGNQEGALGSARFGAQPRPGLSYRISSKYNSRSGLLLASGDRANDNLRKQQGGFRIDWARSEQDEALVSGDVYEGDNGERYALPVRAPPFARETAGRATFSGANLSGRWTRKHSKRSLTQVQVYFNRTVRDNLLEGSNSFSLWDAELQHQLEMSRHDLVFGAGYRFNDDRFDPGHFATLDPVSRAQQRVNFFAQDEITLIPEKLLLTVGAKFENSSFLNWTAQPAASLLWNPTPKDTVWFSAVQADRVPTRVNRDLVAEGFVMPGPQGSVVVGRFFGNEEVHQENLSTVEIGYRATLYSRLSLDLVAFYNQYQGILDLVPGPPVFKGGSPPLTILPLVFMNLRDDVTSYGAETAVSWKPQKAVELRAAYSWVHGGVDTQSFVRGPGHQLHANWFWNLSSNLEWDIGYYFVDGYSRVPSYHRVDSRLGWRPHSGWDFSVVLQNLLDNQHPESPPLLAVPTEIGRSIYGKLTWRFGDF